MIALIVHAVLGLIVIGLIVASNPQIFRRVPNGPALSVLECVYYIAGIAATVIGYYFNVRYIQQYAHGPHNPFWGPGSWAEFIKLGYANPAASSASEDYTIASVILLPVFTIVDGYRRNVRRPWLFTLLILFTTLTFALAYYLATIERQRRLAREQTAPAMDVPSPPGR